MTSTDAPENEIIVNQPLSIQDLHTLRDKSFGYGNNREVSLKVTEIRKGDNLETIKDLELGEDGRVLHKAILQSFDSVSGLRRRVIGFHSHPDVLSNPDLIKELNIDTANYPKHGSAAEMLPSIAPSYLQYLTFGGPGDLALTFPHSDSSDNPEHFEHDINGSGEGGALNIITKDGITLFVGIKPLERDLNVTAKLKHKMGENLDDQFKPTWKVLYGSNIRDVDDSLTSFGDKMEAASKGVDLLADKGVAVTRLDYFSAQKALYFVHLSWEVFDKMIQESGGLQEITFGQGLPKLVSNLQKEYGIPNITVPDSLTDALTTRTFPIRRGKDSIEGQNKIYGLIESKKWRANEWETFNYIIDSLESASEMRNGVELRALLSKMTEQIPWPESSRNVIRNLLKNEKTGEELLHSVETRIRLERAVDEKTDYVSLLPKFYFDEIADIAIQKYLQNPTGVVRESEHGRPGFKDDYVSRLISTISHDKKMLEDYLSRWISSNDVGKLNFAKWIQMYEDSFSWPL